MIYQIPAPVLDLIRQLNNAGFEAYAVGGCVRDLLKGIKPKDWDITTSASVDKIQEIFPEHVYENTFGTVTVKTNSDEPSLNLIEVTPYRTDGPYTDGRHPDFVKFDVNLNEDLSRRDFTVNAMALNNDQIIDPHNGQHDLKLKTIKAVGDSPARFNEDALRLIRAVRFACTLDFEIDPATLQAMTECAPTIDMVSKERIRDELVKIIQSKSPEKGFNLLQETGLLPRIIPELSEGHGVAQNRHHVYTIFDHAIKSCQAASDMNFSFEVRLAALLHDIGKSRTRRNINGEWTFYGHEVVGAEMAKKVLIRFNFKTETIQKVTHLIRQHMFYYDIDKVSEAGARRLLKRVGIDNWPLLMDLRKSERIGSGVPKAEPYRLRHLQFLVEKATKDPISVNQLAIDGNIIIKELGLKPGPTIGGILNALLSEVLDDPSRNNHEYLINRAQELKNKNPDELKQMGKDAIFVAEEEREGKIKAKYHV